MKKNKLKFILLVILIPLLTYCGGVRDALEGKKRSEQNDEFLVKKKKSTTNASRYEQTTNTR